MSDQGRTQRADALIARMKEARGYIYPEWEFAARQDPDFADRPISLGSSSSSAPWKRIAATSRPSALNKT